MRPEKEEIKKVTIAFDLTKESDKKIIDEINNYSDNYNQKIQEIFKDKKKNHLKMTEAQALKKFIETRGDLKLIDDVINSFDEEIFYSYAHKAHCKKTGIEIGKYEFFRNELPKYKDNELRKMVQSILS
ncbi:MAG: hypothetical protein HQK52_17165 [Oligoflexia bacterium]|nr:hypothetical protein [Oligoflexia bacterium]